MSRFAVLSLNPAIDQTAHVDSFHLNTVNRSKRASILAGGKGTNVASLLAQAGEKVTITGFLGRDNSALFEDLFTRWQIRDSCIRIPGSTRIGIKIVDDAVQQTTDINLPGLPPSPADLEMLMATIRRLARDHDRWILTGSLPPGVPDNVYGLATRIIKDSHGFVVLDSSGPALHAGVQSLPDILKPNRAELEGVLGKSLPDLSAVRLSARQLIEMGVQEVIVSLGEDGALFSTRDTCLLAVPPHIPLVSTVGAGDALVAGYLSGLTRGYDLEARARLATAFSMAVLTSEARLLPPPEEIERLSRQVQVIPAI